MSAEIVPSKPVQAPAVRDEAQVTRYLATARERLHLAVEATGPQQVAAMRAELSTVHEATRQMNLSKEIREDAAEMVRRSEYGLGKAIRAGQANGTIRSHGGDVKSERIKLRQPQLDPASPYDFAPHTVLHGDGKAGGNGVYAMAEASEEEFEQALSDARDEQNLSRSNVVRKTRKEGRTGAEVQQEKWGRITDLAGTGHTSRQVAEIVGMSHGGVKNGAKQRGIEFPADRVVGKSRPIDTNRIIRESLQTLDGVAMALDLINPDDIDPTSAPEWVDSLTMSISALTKAKKKIKESLQ